MPDDALDLVDVLALHPMLPLAWRTAGLAARFLRDERPAVLSVEAKSSPTDAVTFMDRTAERIIIAEVLGARPTDGVLGEEGGERPGTSGVRWIIDPLDGTVNYLARLPLWGVSIGVEEAGLATLGVVVTPELGESYIGVLGHGSWRIAGPRAERLRVRDTPALGSALVATGFAYDSERRRRQAAVAAGLIPQIGDIRRLGAAVVDLCWTARGRLDAYYECGLHHWDYAAGALIAAEAGAVVTSLRDDSLGEFVLASAPGIAPDLRAALLALDADRV